jgi:hypothetical protein
VPQEEEDERRERSYKSGSRASLQDGGADIISLIYGPSRARDLRIRSTVSNPVRVSCASFFVHMMRCGGCSGRCCAAPFPSTQIQKEQPLPGIAGFTFLK